MPDDPRLGEYREDFAGMVGSFYEYPLPAKEGVSGFNGATEIISEKKLYARLTEDHKARVDTQAFLKARLFDVLIGDFDRHRKQWRWALLPGSPLWQPIPEDRDQAFVRYDGLGQRMGSLYAPILQNYGDDYPSMEGLTLHGWEQDRWLLAGLDWLTWEAVAKDLQRRLSDQVIDDAINAMPPEYVVLDGERLRRDLRGRRDKLVEAARAYYEHLSTVVTIHATNAAERVQIEWTLDDNLLIKIWDLSQRDNPDAAPVFARRIESKDTDEVRVYLKGGDDDVTVLGDPGNITLRLVSDTGKKRIDDHLAGDTFI